MSKYDIMTPEIEAIDQEIARLKSLASSFEVRFSLRLCLSIRFGHSSKWIITANDPQSINSNTRLDFVND